MANDLIDRQAAIDALDGNVIVTSKESAQAVMDYIRGCADRIRSLPSAQPDLDSAYTEGYTQAEAKYRKMWDEMQATQPERKTGKWIEVEVFPESYDIYGNKTWSSEMQCDQCGFRHTAIEGHMAQYNFCPNCGARMVQEGEEP